MCIRDRNNNKPNQAKTIFREIIQRWPKSPGITDEAYFRIGEMYYNNQKYNSAIQEFIRVIDNFKNGNFADNAYYRVGMCSLKLNAFEDAKVFFSALIDTYPKSPLIEYARKKL